MTNIPIRYIHAAQTETNFSESFTIRNVYDVLAGKDMIQQVHRHDYFYILALKKGSGDHTIDFTSYKVCDHAVFFLRPGQVHQLTLIAGCTGYLMQFNTEFYSSENKMSHQLLRRASTTNMCLFDIARFEKLLVILTYIFQEYTDKHDGYQEVIKASLCIFFIELVRHRKNNNTPSVPVNPYAQERLEEFLELLEAHIYKQKQVTQYATMLHLSSYQLNSITKATRGKTCSDLINEYIILESKRHLLATTCLVSQIACTMGYEDISYFIRFFKKHTGYSPEAFRHNFK
jgi:AraC family transcriptional activator of pobA